MYEECTVQSVLCTDDGFQVIKRLYMSLLGVSKVCGSATLLVEKFPVDDKRLVLVCIKNLNAVKRGIERLGSVKGGFEVFFLIIYGSGLLDSEDIGECTVLSRGKSVHLRPDRVVDIEESSGEIGMGMEGGILADVAIYRVTKLCPGVEDFGKLI